MIKYVCVLLIALYLSVTVSAKCPQNFVADYHLHNATISNGDVTQTFEARTEIIGCHGNGCSVDHKYKCSDGQWYSLGSTSVDLTKALRDNIPDKEIALNHGRRTQSEGTTQADGFTCGSGVDYVLSKIAMEHVESKAWGGDGSISVYKARTQTYCYLGGCSIQNQFYYRPNSVWCRLGGL